MAENTETQIILAAIKDVRDRQDATLQAVSDIKGSLSAQEVTNKQIEENKKDIKSIKENASQNKTDIKALHEWKNTFDKIVWEIVKPPLKAFGIAVILVVAVVGVWVFIR